jgi:hypothetical protein
MGCGEAPERWWSTPTSKRPSSGTGHDAAHGKFTVVGGTSMRLTRAHVPRGFVWDVFTRFPTSEHRAQEDFTVTRAYADSRTPCRLRASEQRRRTTPSAVVRPLSRLGPSMIMRATTAARATLRSRLIRRSRVHCALPELFVDCSSLPRCSGRFGGAAVGSRARRPLHVAFRAAGLFPVAVSPRPTGRSDAHRFSATIRSGVPSSRKAVKPVGRRRPGPCTSRSGPGVTALCRAPGSSTSSRDRVSDGGPVTCGASH